MAETKEERQKRHHQEDLQRLRGFRPIDDTFNIHWGQTPMWSTFRQLSRMEPE